MPEAPPELPAFCCLARFARRLFLSRKYTPKGSLLKKPFHPRKPLSRTLLAGMRLAFVYGGEAYSKPDVGS